jgi:hypothetical protein
MIEVWLLVCSILTCFFLSRERLLPVGFCPLGVVYRKAGLLYHTQPCDMIN